MLPNEERDPVKLEPADHHVLPISGISANIAADIAANETKARIDGLAAESIELRYRLDAVVIFHHKQESEMADLKEQNVILVSENKELKQKLELQEDKIKQLEERLTESIATVTEQLNQRLENQNTNFTSTLEEKFSDIERKTDTMGTKLTDLNQRLQQENTDRVNKQEEVAEKYNTHTHDVNVDGVGPTAIIVAKYGEAYSHSHSARTQYPKPRF